MIKVVLWDEKRGAMLAAGIAEQGVRQEFLALRLLDRVCRKAGMKRRSIHGMVATGYGRDLLACADQRITEITCHACGVRVLTPNARTVIDIGGQDSKVIHLDATGKVHDFVMNDRCAAGTGRFLEVVARRLDVSLKDLGHLAGRAKKPAAISSMCVVFAETEIVGLLAQGASPASIVAGVQLAMATRLASMAGRHVMQPVVFTGGVALIPGMAKVLSSALQCSVSIVPTPQYTGALGAAILAARGGMQ